MKDHYVRVAAVTPEIVVADPAANRAELIRRMQACADEQVKVAVFPELCLSGYTCGDLFLQTSLVRSVKRELETLLKATAELDCVYFVGLPWELGGKLYNCMAVIFHGNLIGLVPKTTVPAYGEFSEGRYFTAGEECPREIMYTGTDGESQWVPMGSKLLFACEQIPELVIAAEIGEELWSLPAPGVAHVKAGATLIVSGAADSETAGKAAYRRELLKVRSAAGLCAHVHAEAGEGESTTDLVFAGHDLICENGQVLAESERFVAGMILADVDLDRLQAERRRKTGFGGSDADYETVTFDYWECPDLALRRPIDPSPFVPQDPELCALRCREILNIQAAGLSSRMKKIGAKTAVVGVSGGLDSTLALLVTARAMDRLGLPRSGILAVTMPCFGTTDRTYQNACVMAQTLGAELKEINIKAAVTQHFADIGHDPSVLDVTFENAQARERTQVLMDLANERGGLVIGTGDMSELALGWATYNGDHMSMYGVNGSVPKTLVRHLVAYFAETCGDAELTRVLRDVLDTPVSPELLPPKDGEIAQKTEDLVGPYELHDFFLYYILRFGYAPAKIFRLAKVAFAGQYTEQTIYHWLYTFYRRFFSQQFKRSCLPDGPKVGSVGVSPRGDLRMPSDASARLWLQELEEVKPLG